MRQKRGKFDKREAVGGEHVERIAEELIGPRAEMMEMPAMLQDLGEFRDPDKIFRFLLQRIESDRELRVGGSDHDELVAQVATEFPFACGDGAQEKRRGIAVQVEVDESSVRLNVLLAHVLQKRAFAASRLAEHCDVHRPLI